ncbi:hypothetical protein MauCBS54593_004367 [Microsporum audouinii]
MANSQPCRSMLQALTLQPSALQHSPGHTPFARSNANMRRATSAAHIKTSNIPVSRLDEARQRPPVARAKEGQDVLRSFVGLLEGAREELAEDLNTAISNNEETMKNRLDEMTTAYIKRADQFQVDCRKIFAQIQTSDPKDLSAKSNSVSVSGIDLDTFMRTVEAENRSLDRLWAEWEKIQQKITYLAVEVLGVDEAGIAKGSNTRIMKKRINRAAALFRKQVSEQEAMLAELQKQDHAVMTTATNSVKQLKARQKKCIDRRKKQREEVCQLAKKMMANV